MPSSILGHLYEAQARYNLNFTGPEPDKTAWTQQYLLGLVSEIDEVLREINWKPHRNAYKEVNPDNLGQELADLTKYVLSLWILWGFKAEDMLTYVTNKSKVLEFLYTQEHRPPLGWPVVVCDLDGVLANYQWGFLKWVKDSGQWDLDDDACQRAVYSLHMDLTLGIPNVKYEQMKRAFEEWGGFLRLPPYPGIPTLIGVLKETQAHLVVVTARPMYQRKRLSMDTLLWLEQQGLSVEGLYFDEDKVELIHNLWGNHVLCCIEDNPLVAERLSKQGYLVILMDRPYNRRLKVAKDSVFRVKDLAVAGKILAKLKGRAG